ncbi:uncharacterized protein [Acropora muricata]|uniref:uncharacterized protein isoform X4 n=1 Tax=Acropora muricata TaxID=159855 RepID=UPI0034E4A5A1
MKHPIVVNLLSFLALYLLSKAQASHFRHAILTWAPVNSYSNTLILRFRMAFRRSFSPSYNCDQSIINSGALRGSGGSWIARCRNSYCSSRTIADTGFQCTDFSVDEDWTMGEKNFTYTFASVSKEWVVSYQGCCWISSLVKYPDGNWLVTTTINLTRRSDTGRINSSPVSKSPAIIRFKEGCLQSFRIPVEDPDDDVVRCRWATYPESSRHNDSFPHGVIDERACLLQYNARRSGTAGTYAVALTLEDFPVGTTDFNSATPFSAVGLQFLVIISARSGSCADRPLFTKATPTDGECTEVQIGLAYRAVIEVTLQDPSKRVTKIVTSSPVGMQLTPLRYDVSRGIFSRNITWYPTQYQVGQQLYCFKAVDSAGSESEWRCITILVGLSNTPRVVLGTRWPRYPSSQLGTGLIRLSIQFDRVIKKPRTSAYIRLVLLPREHTVYKVDTLSRNVVISANKTELLFTLPKAALSMKGSYAILIDRGAVVGSGCSFDGPPTPGISSSQGWRFNVGGICSSGYYLDPPYYRTCTDVNECGSQSRKKRFAWWWPVTSIISIPTSAFSAIATTTPAFSQVSSSTPGVSASAMIPLSLSECFNHAYLEDSVRRQGFYNGYYGYYQCDNNLAFGWYRFRGAAGTQMPTKCVERNRCSSHAPGWLNASHPSVEDGIVTAKVCFHWTSGCCSWSTNIRVRNCGGFYVYELRPAPACWLRYCGNGGPNQSSTISSPQTSLTPAFSPIATSTPAFYPAPTSTSGVSVSASPSFPSGSCGYNFTDRQGNLTSPNYPFSYPNNLNCLWTITATPGDYIYLYFTYFYVQGYSYSWWYGRYGNYGYNSYCPYDYVEIFDLNYPSSFIKVQGCGYQSPWCVKSKNHVMHIRFVTNSIYSYTGFTANYTVYRTPPVGDNCLSLNPYASSSTIFSATPTFSTVPTSFPAFSPVPTSNPGSCRYNLVNPQENFTSPNHPSLYPHNLNCLWTITAAPGYYIDLHFINFYVERCPYDYVEVFDQNYPSSSIKVKRCGYQSPWCVTSTSKVLYVRFVTDGSVAYSGFFASYTNHPNPFSGNCISLNATQIQTTQAVYPASTSTTGVPASASVPLPSGSCRYNFTARQGNLTSPNYPFSYPNNLNCLWTITATPGDYIYLYFTYFYVQGYYYFWWYGRYGNYGYNSYCPYDYVEIFDLNYPSSFIKVQGCGYQSPWCVKSKNHVMHIRFVTNSIYSYTGFTANYTVYRTPPVGDNCLSLNPYASSSTIFSATPTFSTVPTSFPAFSPVPTSNPGSCRYNLVNPQENFTSPNHPSLYPHNLNCLWTITAAPGYYIDLHFINFYVERCPYDYVEVFDQNYPSSSIKVKRCGYQSPWCVTSTSKVLYVRFVTDGSVAYSGFFASYTNHPNPFSGNCISLNATQIQTTQVYPASTSTTGVPASASVPLPSGSCRYNFTARQGNLTSPNYPFSYPNNLNCLWTITATPGDYIYLYFTYFYVQGYYYFWWYGRYGNYGYNSYCPYDYVEIFDLNYPSSFIKVQGCGYQSPWCVKSKNHVMHIRFVTNSIYSYTGFTANYTVYRTPPVGDNCLSLNPYASSSTIFSATPTFSTVPTSFPAFSPVPTSNPGSCRYNLVNPQENFTSPNHPSLYPHNLNCLWTITAAPGYYIDLHFINFYVERCPYDYVEVFDQNYPSSSIKVKRCGYQSPWCVTSTSKVLYVRFVTDGSVAYSGFFASYTNHPNPFSGNCISLNATQIQTTQAVYPASTSTTGVPASASVPLLSGSCGYNFTARQGNLTSPNYPYSYPNNLNCLWTITTTPGDYIYLHFTYFYVQGYYYPWSGNYGYNSYCPYDYVEIFDLVYPLTSIKIRGCGYQSPWCVKSKSHVMLVRFVTDSFSSYRGFTAHYRVYTNPPAGGNCLPLNALPMLMSPYASSSRILQATPSTYTNTKYVFSASTSTSVGIIYPTPASKRLPHYSSTVSQEKVPDFHLQLPADCEQVCHNTLGSYICSCVSGYQLASDGKSCSDINECSVNNGGCSHHCYNIPGAHYCGCPKGTTMAANNLTCVQPGVAVTCGKHNMTISLEKQSFSFVRAEEVHLRYSSCKATENGTHVTISTLLNDCGTSVNETQDALLFWNELRVDAVIIDGVITRSQDIRLPFYCSYSRKKLLSLSFNPLGVYYGQEAGYGNFTFKMDFFKSGSFLVPYSTADYPLQLRLNDYIYVRYSVESSADLVIMAENCRATKDGSFYSLPQYKIIQNGCGRDTTMVYSYNSNRPYQEFRMKVFRFFNDYNAVYLHCELLACHRSSRNSRCQRGCMPGNRRKRRAVGRDGTEHMESTTKNIVSRGPLIFKDEVKQGDTGQGKKVGALIGGVAGAGGVCILAFAALGILFVKYRLARRLMNRNKVGDLYATQEEMGRKSAYVKEDDMNTKEDSL